MATTRGFRRAAPAEPAAIITAPEPALTAAAARVELAPIQVSTKILRDLEWQQEAWRHYDQCGEYRFAVNRHSAAMSRCRFMMVEVDDNGQPGKETKDKQVQELGQTIFGNAAAKAEAVRVASINLYVAGECWIVAEGAADPTNDVWYVVSAKELRKEAGVVKARRPQTVGGGWKVLDPQKDLLMRCWTPHPRLYDVADSPSRAVLPILREIERLTMLTFSQIDSRLAVAGIMLMPDDIEFPHKRGEQTPVQGLMEFIVEAAKQNLQGAGNAAGVVPIGVGLPRDPTGKTSHKDAITHLKFDTPITAELAAKLDQAIRRLALGLDIAPEDLLGQGDANHWAAWQIEESSIKLFIDPACARLCDAWNEGYVRGALKAIGKDPDKFMLWYSTAPLVVRPNRQADAIQLSELDMVGNQAVRAAGDWDDDDKPSAQELLVRRAWKLVTLNPALIADEQIASILGFPVGIQVAGGMGQPPPGGMGEDNGPADPGALGDLLQPTPAGLPPGGVAGNQGASQRGLPQQPAGKAGPAQTAQPRQPAMAASGQLTDHEMATVVPAAEVIVLGALERANARQLTRANRGQYKDVPMAELHTRVRPTTRDACLELLDSSNAFGHVSLVASAVGLSEDDLTHYLREYCAELMSRGYAHEQGFLVAYLSKVRPLTAAA